MCIPLGLGHPASPDIKYIVQLSTTYKRQYRDGCILEGYNEDVPLGEVGVEEGCDVEVELSGCSAHVTRRFDSIFGADPGALMDLSVFTETSW